MRNGALTITMESNVTRRADVLMKQSVSLQMDHVSVYLDTRDSFANTEVSSNILLPSSYVRSSMV